MQHKPNEAATHPGDAYDVIVAGGGAAGLTAAILLARSRRRVAVIDSGTPRNAPADHVRGFLSRDGSSPLELLRLGRDEFTRYGGHVIEGHIERLDARRRVHLADQSILTARRIVVATGLRDVLPDIPGLAERWGRDVLHCPYCHGYEVSDQRLAVLGTHPNAFHHALLLRQWSERVTFVQHRFELDGRQEAMLHRRGVGVVGGTITGLAVTDDRLRGICLDSGDDVPADAAFIFPQPRARDEFLADLGLERDQMGFPVTDETGRTSVEWLWVAGNAANPRAQAITAAGEGSSAGFAVNLDLVMEEVTGGQE